MGYIALRYYVRFSVFTVIIAAWDLNCCRPSAKTSRVGHTLWDPHLLGNLKEVLEIRDRPSSGANRTACYQIGSSWHGLTHFS